MDSIPATAAIPAALLPQDTTLPVWSITEAPVRHGFYAGTPAVVIRLQGCPVGCSWCDQPAGIPEPTIGGTAQLSEEDLEHGGPGFRWISGIRLLALIDGYQSRHVLISGGEPALYDLAWFTESLRQRGYTVQVETSGVLPLSVHRDVWVTLSPTHHHPDLTVWDWLYKRANEVVLLITAAADERWIEHGLKRKALGAVFWIKPLHGRPDLIKLCWALARRFMVRIALQDAADRSRA